MLSLKRQLQLILMTTQDINYQLLNLQVIQKCNLDLFSMLQLNQLSLGIIIKSNMVNKTTTSNMELLHSAFSAVPSAPFYGEPLLDSLSKRSICLTRRQSRNALKNMLTTKLLKKRLVVKNKQMPPKFLKFWS